MKGVPSLRPAWVEVDLEAVRHNARLLARLVAPAGLCAVVKADAYGHGAPAVAEAAIESGATMLAVALVEEGIELRKAGLTGEILLLSEPTAGAMTDAIASGLTPSLYRHEGVAAACKGAAELGRTVTVQLKVDTGMHRVGADVDALLSVAEAVEAAPELVLGGLWTHLAVADESDDPFTSLQLERFERARLLLVDAGIEPGMLHAANSAGAIAHPGARLDMVRCGIALYGHLPAPELSGRIERELASQALLVPALSLKAELHLVRHLPAGERTSYGRTYELKEASYVGVVPLGYHDGVPRRFATAGGEVLVGGKRRPIAGTVTMDQLLVDLGDDASVRPGDEVVLIGRQGDEEVTAEEWAERLGIVVYEVLCGIGARVPRRFVNRRRAFEPPAGQR